jgi:hypothetical protein
MVFKSPSGDLVARNMGKYKIHKLKFYNLRTYAELVEKAGVFTNEESLDIT